MSSDSRRAATGSRLDRTSIASADISRHPRLLPARPDLAAASLRGLVDADRYVEGRRRCVAADVLDLKREPRADSALDTQLLHGESVLVLEDREGWAWVQAESDSYVGYVASHALHDSASAVSHRVVVARTFVYPAADMKQPIAMALPLGALVSVEAVRGSFSRLRSGGFVWNAHLRPIDETPFGDVVATAENLLGAPYLWGGRTPQGLDCSGLVQLSFTMGGLALPRDASMQEKLGSSVPIEAASSGLKRGDLVFWPGHVGLMADGETLIHASGHQMLVCAEPLQVVRRRIAGGETRGEISSVRRQG